MIYRSNNPSAHVNLACARFLAQFRSYFERRPPSDSASKMLSPNLPSPALQATATLPFCISVRTAPLPGLQLRAPPHRYELYLLPIPKRPWCAHPPIVTCSTAPRTAFPRCHTPTNGLPRACPPRSGGDEADKRRQLHNLQRGAIIYKHSLIIVGSGSVIVMPALVVVMAST